MSKALRYGGRSIVAVLLLILFALPAAAVIKYESPVRVTKVGVENGDGRSWEKAISTEEFLRIVGEEGHENFEFWLEEGTYDVAEPIKPADGVKIYGGFNGETDREDRDPVKRSVLVSKGVDRVIEVGVDDQEGESVGVENNGPSLTLDGLTISGPGGGADGGGILINGVGVKVTANNCLFESNKGASAGGAVLVGYYATFTATYCTFTGNEATMGGAVVVGENATFTATNCKFTDNEANMGGIGGAVYVYQIATFTATNCTFTGNEAGWGGAVYVSIFATFTATNCTFVENVADLLGGALYSFSSSNSEIINCTFADNKAKGRYIGDQRNNEEEENYGDAVFLEDLETVKFTAVNTIFWGDKMPIDGGDGVGATRSLSDLPPRLRIISAYAPDFTTSGYEGVLFSGPRG
ncbi:MAG: right-handed parallel beta-helix repeat-containing protein [Aminivibrio sp.]